MVIIIGDAEARLQADVGSKLAQQLGAECVNRSALHAVGARAQLPLETRRYLTSGLVGERENADAFRIESALLDEKSNPLDQAECLAGAGAGENQDRLGESLDRLALGIGGDLRWIRGDRRSYGDDRLGPSKARDGTRQAPPPGL